jgi:hypothetical protein
MESGRRALFLLVACSPCAFVSFVFFLPSFALRTAVVPPHLQVLFANVVALAWNTYLSWQSHKTLEPAAAAAPAPVPADKGKKGKKN